MANGKPAAILCQACGQESLLKRAPRYDGFKRSGETLSCAACGHEFANEAGVPFLHKSKPADLDAKNLPPPPRIFRENENARLCRYCEFYVVNPFVQRCTRRQKEVEATDTCRDFRPKPEPPPAPAKPAAKPTL